MASLFRVCLVLFIFTGVTMHRADAFLRKYVSLILDLHEFYKSSSVCFIMPSKNQNLSETTLAHVLSREFSRSGVQSLIANSEGMKGRTSKCQNCVVRPLIVVLLTTVEDVNDFAEEIRGTSQSFPIWLLIFSNDFSPSVCEYCENPTNIFGLNFNTEMLVACCKDSTINEWLTIHGNETRAAFFGKWTSQDGLEIKTVKSLYARRSNVNGTKLRIAYVRGDISRKLNTMMVAEEDLPAVTILFYTQKTPSNTFQKKNRNSAFRVVESGKFGGFFDALLEELKRVMKFEISTILEGHGFGSWSSVTQTWSGVVELINNGEVDLGVAEFSMTSHRLDVVDFTLPFMMSQLQLYIKAQDSSGVQWSAHFKAFAYQIWVTIIVLVIASTLLVAAIKRTTGLHSFPYLIVEHYLYVWGIFCQQGLAVFPAETSLRIAYSSIFVSALVVSAAYSASLISFITVSTGTVPFSSLLEFANDGSYRLIVLQNSSDWNIFDSSPDPVMVKMKRLLKPSNELPQSMTDGFKQLCTEKVAFFTSEVMAKTSHKFFPCKVGQINTGSIDSLAMILPAKSPFTGVVNYHIQRFQDNGMINRWKFKYLRNPSELEVTPNEVTLWGVAPILSVLAGGIILSLVFLSCEKRYKPRSRLGHTWATTNLSGFHSRRTRNRKPLSNEHRKQRTTYLP